MAVAISDELTRAKVLPSRVKKASTAAAVKVQASPAPKPKAKKSPPAVLELISLCSKSGVRVPRSIVHADTVKGVLTVAGHEFKMADADMLGTIAFICGVATVKAVAPSCEDVIVLRAKAPSVHEIGKAAVDEKEFLYQFHQAHHIAATSGSQTFATLKWWTEKRLAPALAKVPEHLRLNIEFAAGIGGA